MRRSHYAVFLGPNKVGRSRIGELGEDRWRPARPRSTLGGTESRREEDNLNITRSWNRGGGQRSEHRGWTSSLPPVNLLLHRIPRWTEEGRPPTIPLRSQGIQIVSTKKPEIHLLAVGPQ